MSIQYISKSYSWTSKRKRERFKKKKRKEGCLLQVQQERSEQEPRCCFRPITDRHRDSDTPEPKD